MKHPRSISMMWAALSFFFGLCASASACGGAAAASSPSLTEKPAPPPAPSDRRSGKRAHDGFFLQLSLGPAYLAESRSPTAGGPSETVGGWGTSLETSVGKRVRPGLVVGGRWQFAALVDPNDSYEGTPTAPDESARFLDVIGAFVDYYPNPRRGFHAGGSVGLLASTDLDAAYGAHTTSWGPALSAQVGYEVFFSSRWSVGAVAQLSAYRCSTTEAGVSSVSGRDLADPRRGVHLQLSPRRAVRPGEPSRGLPATSKVASRSRDELSTDLALGAAAPLAL